jgi:hypothetical protein
MAEPYRARRTPPCGDTGAVEVVSDRRYHLAATPPNVWAALARTDQYRAWWPWLRALDARGLERGDEWQCTVRPPLPYVVRFSLLLREVEPLDHVTAQLTGDIRGTARIDLRPTGPAGASTELRLRAALEPARPLLGVLGRLAAPVARFGHDWVLDTGARQFAATALRPGP